MPDQSSLQQGMECLKAGKIDEAIQHLELATTHDPRDYKGFNFLGIAYAQKQLFNRSIGALQAAVQIRSDIPSIHYNLGLAYQAEGFNDKAEDQYKHALKIDPTYVKATEALKSIDAQRSSGAYFSSRSCARHTDEPAVGICSYCQLPVCKECEDIVNGVTYCTNCAPKG